MTVGKANRWVLWTIGAVILLAFFLLGGAAGYMYAQPEPPQQIVAASKSQPSPSPTAQSEAWAPFWETYNIIKETYYGRPVDEKQLADSAAKGMVEGLEDPYSAYMAPREAQIVESDMSGRFEGIGVYVDTREEKFVVVAPIPGSPAAKAGLQSGDVILKVDGQDISEMEQLEVVTKIRGPNGSKVTLTIQRGSQNPFDVTITRDEIQVPQVEYDLLQGDIAHIRVNLFGDQTTAELDAALQRARQDQAKGIILDLRGNGGGWVVTAREMLGRFLDGGIAMYEDKTKGPGGEQPLEVITATEPMTDIPMVVLVNQGTASASEIVAGALQARDRAILVGDMTFGKGSEQLVHELSRGARAHITVAHWLTPDKVDIHEHGLTPDVLVKTTDADTSTSGPQQQRAIRELQRLIQEGQTPVVTPTEEAA